MVLFFLCQKDLLKVDLSPPVEQHKDGSPRSLRLSTGNVVLSRQSMGNRVRQTGPNPDQHHYVQLPISEQVI